MKTLLVRKDARLSFSYQDVDKKTLKIIRKKLTHRNPEFFMAERMGFSTMKIPYELKTYSISKKRGRLYFQRGSKKKIFEILSAEGYRPEIIDKTTPVEEVEYPNKLNFTPRKEQEEFVKYFKKYEEGLLQCYTSFGKSLAVALAAYRLKLPILVCVHSTDLQKQWIAELTTLFGLERKHIGGAGGVFAGKKAKLKLFNIGINKSLAKEEYLSLFRENVGIFVLDECQFGSINDNQEVIKQMPCKYRFGVSDNHRRKDGKHFLTTDSFGPVVKKFKEGGTKSKILGEIRLVPTEYTDSEYEADMSFTDLESRVSLDSKRNSLILKRTLKHLKDKRTVMVFCSRKYQAARIYWKLRKKYRCALITGKIDVKKDCPHDIEDIHPEVLEIMKNHKDSNSEKVKEMANKKELDCIICTKKAEIGFSVNSLDAGVVGSLVMSNVERIKQILGRIERLYKEWQKEEFGHEKSKPVLDVLWDRNVGNIEDKKDDVLRKFKGRVKIVKFKNK